MKPKYIKGDISPWLYKLPVQDAIAHAVERKAKDGNSGARQIHII